MSDKSWKQFERRIARRFGGRRRGAQTSRDGEGLSDCVGTPGFSIECALGRKYTSYAAILAKCQQAERAAADGEIPIAVIKAPRVRDTSTLVAMRLPEFLAWFGPAIPTSEEDSS